MVPCAKLIVRTWAVKIQPRSVQGKNPKPAFVTEQELMSCTALIDPGLALLRSPGTWVKGLAPCIFCILCDVAKDERGLGR